ncbi:hypothetical protein B0H11DRAFT_2355960 [Mycena galericulata]|nr:hypothetical protein B0H11DRAFT_2355960 [Mycena galericulata]
MRFLSFALSLPFLRFVSGTSFESPPFYQRRDLYDALPRQEPQDPLTPFPNLTNAQLEVAYAAQCNAINSAVGQQQVQADIQNATTAALAIDSLFTQIGVQLAGIDAQNLNNGNYFGPEWDGINKQWNNLLGLSRTTARNTAAYCNEFTTSIMPMVANLTEPIPLNLSVEMLENYSAACPLPIMAEDLALEAQDTSEAFTGLNNSINAFIFTFRTFAVAKKSGDQAAIDKLNANIATLQAQIKSYNEDMKSVGIAMGATVLAARAVIWLFPLSSGIVFEAAVLALALETVSMGILFGLRSSAESQLASQQEQLTTLQGQLSAIASANSTLYTTTLAADHLMGQLSGFNSIWNAVVSDCTEVAEYITTANTPLARNIPLIFWATINNVDCLYQALAVALDNYALGITNSENLKREESDFPAKLHTNVEALVSSVRAKADAFAKSK